MIDIFNELEFNNKSQTKNLLNFFEDSKILFKKLREKRHEIILKENQKEGANNHKIKKGFKYIFPIILNSLLGLIVFSDFILYLASPRVRIILLYLIKVYYLHLYF